MLSGEGGEYIRYTQLVPAHLAQIRCFVAVAGLLNDVVAVWAQTPQVAFNKWSPCSRASETFMSKVLRPVEPNTTVLLNTVVLYVWRIWYV